MKTRLLAILMLLGVLQSVAAYTLTVVSGENGSTQTTWQSVTGGPGGDDTIDINGGTQEYSIDEGMSVTMEFSPFDYQKVERVTFNGTDITNRLSSPYEGAYIRNYTFEMTGDVTVNVTYRSIYDIISITSNGPGTTNYEAYGSTESLRDSEGQAEIDDGTDYTITMIPDEGYSILSVVVNDVDMTSQLEDNPTGGDGKVLTLSNVTENKAVVVTYGTPGRRVIIMSYNSTEAEYALGRTYCPESGVSEGYGPYDGAFDFSIAPGNTINLTFEPASGCKLDSVVVRTSRETGDETETIPGTAISGLAYSIYIMESMTELSVSVYYGQIVTHNVTITSVGQGTVNANTEEMEYVAAPNGEITATVNEGSWLSMTFTPEANHRFSSLTIDGEPVDAAADSTGVVMYTIPEVTASMAVVATFEEIPTVATPTIVRDGRLFSLTTETEEATIYYAFVIAGQSDAVAPNYQVYSDAETHLLDGAGTIYAYATKDNYNQSATASFTVSEADMTAAVPSGFAFADGRVTLTVPEGCTVRYTTDGGVPTEESTPYEDGITVTSNVTIRARSFCDNWFSSDIAEYTVDAFKVADVTFAQNGNIITLSTTTEGATIYYTLSTEPTGSTGPTFHAYTEPLTMTGDCTISAYATRDGWTQSDETTYEFHADGVTCSDPVLARTEGTNVVTATNSTEGATVYYTTDGSDPTAASSVFPTEGLTVAHNMTIKAVAMRDNYYPSQVVTFTVDWFQVETPAFAWNGDQLTISTGTEGASIYYTRSDEVSEEGATERLYTGPITVTADATITAVARLQDFNDSETATLVYPYTAWKELMDTAVEGQSIVDNYSGNAHVSGDQIIELRNLISSATSMYAERTADEDAIHAKTTELQTAIAEIQALLAIKDAYAVLSDNTLTFYYDNQKGERGGMDIGPFSSEGDRAWNEQSHNITAVSFDESFADYTTLTSTAHWFHLCANLTTINGLANLHTTNVTDMSHMFEGCYRLQTIYVGDGWSTGSVTESTDMFLGCTALVGGNGTTYDADHVDASYAHVDGGERNPGYLSLLLTMGDANGDGEVNIADAVATVTNILGEETEAAFYKNAADMNADSEIDIFDVTLIVNAALNAGARSDVTRGGGSDVATENAWLTTGAETAYVDVAHTERYTAMQFDLTLPVGINLEDVRLSSGATDHQLSYVSLGGGEYRVIALSMSNSALPTANGHLLQLRLSQPAGEGSIALSRLLLVTPGAQTVTAISETLANNGGATTADGTYYDLRGQRIGHDKQQLGKGVYIVNHKKVIIK